MGERIEFKSLASIVGSMPTDFDVSVLKTEPQFFSVDLDFARQMGGEITRTFLAALPEDWQTSDLVIDSRVHMLMPGWFPCIPGWHLDDVPRPIDKDGQVNEVQSASGSEHICAIIGDCSRTEFALGECQLEEPESGKIVFGEWHKDLEEILKREDSPLTRLSIEEGKLYQFDWQTWHRGTPATKSGWRWFIRVTRNTHREVVNEIRTQTQVYLPMEGVSW